MSGGTASSPIKHVSNRTTDANGLWSGAVKSGLRYWVQPTTTGEFANTMSVSGATASIAFRKFKTGGLGITLGTLLSVQAFEDTSGIVNFNLFGAEDCD